MITTETEIVREEKAGRRKGNWQMIVIILLLLDGACSGLLMLFQEPETRAIAVSAFTCGVTTMVIGFGVYLLRRTLKPPRIPGWMQGLLFIMIGTCGAVWAETVYWAFEKIFGAAGVAAHPNLIVDLLVTMPWYICMVTVLWFVHRRYRYHWTTIALLGAFYELFGDGILGGYVLGGNGFSLSSLLYMVFFFAGIFLLTYSPMVLPPVWLFPMDDEPYAGPGWHRIVGAFLPLLPLIPYGALAVMLSSFE